MAVAAASHKVRAVPTWLWLAPAAAAALPLVLLGCAWLLSLLDPSVRYRSSSFSELFILSVLFAPAVGLFVLVYLTVLILIRRLKWRDRATVSTAGLAALCVAEPFVLLTLMFLTHGITR